MLRSVRVFYAKRGRMKYVSHLDMNRYMIRLFKSAKIPAWYTEGFNQHLYMTFALPMSLGLTTDYDVIDLKITDDDFTNEQILKCLKEKAAEGIEILNVAEPWCKVPELKYASYTLTLRDADADLLKSFEKFLHSNAILAEKKGKKNKVTLLNLAEKIRSVDTEITGDTLVVRVVLPAGNQETVNPQLFLQSFEGAGNRRPEVVLINRDMLYTENMQKFE